jgi:hypothetical protein
MKNFSSKDSQETGLLAYDIVNWSFNQTNIDHARYSGIFSVCVLVFSKMLVWNWSNSLCNSRRALDTNSELTFMKKEMLMNERQHANLITTQHRPLEVATKISFNGTVSFSIRHFCIWLYISLTNIRISAFPLYYYYSCSDFLFYFLLILFLDCFTALMSHYKLWD